MPRANHSSAYHPNHRHHERPVDPEKRSECCDAPVDASDLLGKHQGKTTYYLCSRCGNVCDVVMTPERWTH